MIKSTHYFSEQFASATYIISTTNQCYNS